jgi:hypothetical protein
VPPGAAVTFVKLTAVRAVAAGIHVVPRSDEYATKPDAPTATTASEAASAAIDARSGVGSIASTGDGIRSGAAPEAENTTCELCRGSHPPPIHATTAITNLPSMRTPP